MAISALGALMSTASVALGLQTGILGLGVFGHFLVTTAIGAAINALTPKPKFNQGVQGYNVTQSGSNLDHQIIYGRVRTAGARVFDSTTGNNNSNLHRVIAFAGHEVNSFEELWINDAKVTTLDPDGNVAQVLLPDGTTSSVYSGYLRLKTHNGSATQLADETLVSEVPEWTEDHRLQGIAYIYARFVFNQDKFPNGVPEITATIKGKKVYDPRSGVTEWSNNPALCIRDYLLSDYGLKEVGENVDDSLVITTANVCDETNTLVGSTRYTCNGSFTTGTTPYEILSNILTCMGGLLWYSQGKWRMKPAYWTEPVLTLDENDLRGSIQLSTRHSRRDNFNTVNGTFRGEETSWEITDFPPVSNPDFIAADNGQETSIDMSLPFTDNSIEARRVARIALERNRQQLTVQASFGLRAFRVQVGDNIILNNSRFGWVDKTFEVVSWTFGLVDNSDLQVTMTLREISESTFDEVDDGVIYERDNTRLPSPFFVPPVGVNVTSSTQISRQKVTNTAHITVSASTDAFISNVEVEYKQSSLDIWDHVGVGPLGKFRVVDIPVGNYDFRARAINTLGVKGLWTTLSNVEVNPFTGPPSDVTGFVAEPMGQSLLLRWDPVVDPDLSHYIIKYNSNLTGANWSNSSILVDRVARPSTITTVIIRSGTYLIRAYDKEGFLSENDTTFVVPENLVPSLPDKVSLVENPTFSGTKDNLILDSGELFIDDTATSNPIGTYYFSSPIDLTTTELARVTGRVTFTRYYSNLVSTWDSISGNWDSWPNNWDDWTDVNSAFGDVDVIIYASTTEDNPASGSAVWTDYRPAIGTNFYGRGFRFKAVFKSNTIYFTPKVSALSVDVEY